MGAGEVVEGWAPTRDGRKLHVRRRGSGEPVVVFEAGMGVSLNMWGAVHAAVGERTTAAAYDRSGLGRSQSDPAPRDLWRLADDLIDVLAYLGPGPFVLVGHSWGGPIARVAASLLPDRVAGLVLVDQTDEGCDLFFSKGNQRQERLAVRLAPPLAYLGVLRLAAKRMAAQLPEPEASVMRDVDGTPRAALTQVAELRSSTSDLRRLRDAPPVLPEVPVTVISGTVTSRIERRRRPELVAAHAQRAAALPLGRHVTADRSSHYVPFTEPGLIADEILRIVDLAEAADGR